MVACVRVCVVFLPVVSSLPSALQHAVVRQLQCEHSQSWQAARQMVLQGQPGKTIMSVREVIYATTGSLMNFDFVHSGLVKNKSNQHWAAAV